MEYYKWFEITVTRNDDRQLNLGYNPKNVKQS